MCRPYDLAACRNERERGKVVEVCEGTASRCALDAHASSSVTETTEEGLDFLELTTQYHHPAQLHFRCLSVCELGRARRGRATASAGLGTKLRRQAWEQFFRKPMETTRVHTLHGNDERPGGSVYRRC